MDHLLVALESLQKAAQYKYMEMWRIWDYKVKKFHTLPKLIALRYRASRRYLIMLPVDRSLLRRWAPGRWRGDVVRDRNGLFYLVIDGVTLLDASGNFVNIKGIRLRRTATPLSMTDDELCASGMPIQWRPVQPQNVERVARTS
jgi:hypothetical protein